MRDFILDLIFPIECLNCGAAGRWICQKCFTQLKFNDTQYCHHCKKENRAGRFCVSCMQDYCLKGLLIAGSYEDKILEKLIINFKYHFIKDIAADLGNFLILFLENLQNEKIFNPRDFCILPVPLAKKRERWRGFNQAKEIAEIIAKHFGIMINEDLIRIKHSKPQVKLNENERKCNIVGCFGWQGENLNSRKIILIDDVATTGATLNECAKILKQNGAGEVWGLVAAKG